MQQNADISFGVQNELKAAQGLLDLHYLTSCSDMEPFQLNPIFVGDSTSTQKLPPVSHLLSEYASPSAYTQNIPDDCFYNLVAPTASALSVSSSSSASSIRSFTSTSTLQLSHQQPRTFHTLMHSRRRGRPKKALSLKMAEDLKIVNYDIPSTPVAANNNTTTTINRPRWQDSERQDLIEAIVKEKNLDDMSTIPWDRVSKAVGRAKKACKDQWRRELLPGLVRGFIRYSTSNHLIYEDLGKKKRKNELRK
jgi:hypothetical protein